MIYCEAPHEWVETPGHLSLFLAGGITDCPDWQKDVVLMLAAVRGLALLNPRRARFPIHDPAAAELQVTWEYLHLRLADAILFWFPCETLCPIVLYELGAWSRSDKPLFVGTHPDYARRQDVEIQTRLARPDVPVLHDLQDVVARANQWLYLSGAHGATAMKEPK
jgi:hypothetical protein